jgi:hypothetical protein
MDWYENLGLRRREKRSTCSTMATPHLAVPARRTPSGRVACFGEAAPARAIVKGWNSSRLLRSLRRRRCTPTHVRRKAQDPGFLSGGVHGLFVVVLPHPLHRIICGHACQDRHARSAPFRSDPVHRGS